ncbi:MAG: hypothetical protein EPN91_12770 [Salinibacterium sp.]|nr:MAG: hypothetical protein EPN91_12770 [Salinibacterium sp.]
MTNLAYAPLPHRFAPRPGIELVPRVDRRARPRVAYAVVTVTSVLVIFALQLLLSIMVSQGAYDIDTLQSKQKELLRTEQALGEQIDLYGSTQNLAASAAALGMVPGANPKFLDIGSGQVSTAPRLLDANSCGGSCTNVPNALLTGLGQPHWSQAAAEPTVHPESTTTTTSGTDSLPAPVTH